MRPECTWMVRTGTPRQPEGRVPPGSGKPGAARGRTRGACWLRSRRTREPRPGRRPWGGLGATCKPPGGGQVWERTLGEQRCRRPITHGRTSHSLIRSAAPRPAVTAAAPPADPERAVDAHEATLPSAEPRQHEPGKALEPGPRRLDRLVAVRVERELQDPGSCVGGRAGRGGCTCCPASGS